MVWDILGAALGENGQQQDQHCLYPGFISAVFFIHH
jgi:hypothetical protein